MSASSTLHAWWNALTGQGSSSDHGALSEVGFRAPKTHQEISMLLMRAPLMRTVCEAMGEDIVRAWREHKKSASKWLELEELYEYRDTVERALFFAEAFGGAYILPRYASGVVAEHDLAAQRPALRQGFLGFEVLAQHEVSVADNTGHLKQPNGRPQYYHVGSSKIKIHHSWLRPLPGAQLVPSILRTTDRTAATALGQSRVDLLFDDFARMATAHGSLVHTLVKNNIDVLKLKGLAEALSRCDTTEEMQAELQRTLMTTSSALQGANTYQPMVIDEGEALERKSQSLAGLADIVARLVDMFVAATRMPRTRLLGEQAKGLGNGGEADATLFYDRCASLRERRCTGLLNWMDAIVSPSSRTDWEFLPLWEMTAVAQAELDSKRAETDKKYFDMGLPGIGDAITKRLRENGQYQLPLEPTNAPTN